MNHRGGFSIINLTKDSPPKGGLSFKRAKETVLGTRYELELIFMEPSQSRALNRRYRGKNTPANVLAFPLSPKKGQIVLCPQEAWAHAHHFDRDRTSFIGYLFIHALLHLKGLRHGSTMSAEERHFCSLLLRKKANPLTHTHGKKNNRRNRHRNTPSKGAHR